MNWDDVSSIREQVLKGKPPEGSFTREQYQQQYGLQRSQASVQLSKLVKLGKLQKTIVIVGCARVPHYTTVQLESCPIVQKSKRKTNR